VKPTGSSGVRVRVGLRPGVDLALPLTRSGCLFLSQAILSLADPGGRSSASPAEVSLAAALAGGDVVHFLAGMPAWRVAPVAADADESRAGPDPATVVWLVAHRDSAAGRGGDPRSPDGGPLAALRAALLTGGTPDGVADVASDDWQAWLEAGPQVGGTLGASAEAWHARLRGGDLPETRGPREPPRTVEGRLLAGVLAIHDAHHRLETRFEDEVATARLEAIRELAYGAGHEINNPLANIATRAQTLLVGERDPERRRRLSTIVDQAFRARDLIGGLMLFARPPRPQPGRTDGGRLAAAVAARMEAQAASRGARVVLRSTAAPVTLWADAAMVEEALRAVVANAIEALGEGGSVTVAVQADASTGSAAPLAAVVVADDGIGMDAATRRRAFDPFYSGREAGRGAGLGLSKARRFVEVNGGSLELESRPGVGTIVTMRLPVATPDPHGGEGQEEGRAALNADPG